jgi:hypothetical protein
MKSHLAVSGISVSMHRQLANIVAGIMGEVWPLKKIIKKREEFATGQQIVAP